MRWQLRSLVSLIDHSQTQNTLSSLTSLSRAPLRFSTSTVSTFNISSSVPSTSRNQSSPTIRTSELLSSDTIYALASGRGKCAVAIVRVSGPLTGPIVRALRSDAPLPAPRVATLTPLYHPLSQQLLDRAIVLWNPGINLFDVFLEIIIINYCQDDENSVHLCFP